MIDSHCHLADRQFARDLDAVLERAKSAGITQMVCIADDLKEGEQCLRIAEKYDHIFCTIGVHPHHAKHWKSEDASKLESLLQSSKKVVALGEIGLDYHYDNSPRDVQQAVLSEQLRIAQKLEFPVVIHNRDSISDLMEIIAKHPPKKAVLHCCTEKWEDVCEWVERGYMLSFTGIATYPKSEEIRETIRHTPLTQLMIETDAPYLAPVPHRGKRNEPAYVREVALLVAELHGRSLEEIDKQTTRNTVEFFSLPA